MWKDEVDIVYLYALLIVCYMLNKFIGNLLFDYFIGALAVLTIILSFKNTGRLYKIVGSIFLITGLFIWWFFSPLGIEIFLHFDRLIGLIALFFLLPFLNAVVKVGRYDQILSSIITTNMKNVYQLYQKTSLTSYILSIFLNLAVIPVLFGSVKKISSI